MASLLNLGMDAAAGGVFGIIGTALGRVAGYFERRQTHEQEMRRWSHELALHELNMKSRLQESEIELAIAAQAGSWAGLETSIKADAALGKASLWVINTLRLVRPVLTLLLWVITAGILSSRKTAKSSKLPSSQQRLPHSGGSGIARRSPWGRAAVKLIQFNF